MVKDECDIVELFVKINLRRLDHLFIVDHGSRDGTPEILRRLAASGYAITVTEYEGLDRNQRDVTTRLMSSVAATDEYDFIVPLDADEFIYCGDRCLADVLAAEVPQGGAAQMRWVTYAPVAALAEAGPAPLFHRFRMRALEPIQYFKVVLSNDLAKNAQLSVGNHTVVFNGAPMSLPTSTVLLQHVPVRSAEQLSVKALIGSLRNSIRPERTPAESFHWDQMAKVIRDAGYRLSAQDLFSLACRYATDLAVPAPELEQCIEAAARVGRADDVIEYPELCRIIPMRNFDTFARALSAEVLQHRTAKIGQPADRAAWSKWAGKWKYRMGALMKRAY